MEFTDILWAPFDHFVNLSNRMAYLYLFSALVVSIIAYMVNKARKGEAESVSLLRWLLPAEVLKHPSSQADFAFYFINKMLLALIYGSVLLTAPFAYHALTGAIVQIFGPSTASFEPHLGYSILTTVVIILVLDFSLWFLHLIFHKVPFLWDYHKVHHSAEVMTPLTAARMHPVEEVVDSLTTGLTVGATMAILHHLLGPAAIQITLFEVNIFLAVFYFSAFHLRHSHVWIRYPYWIQHIFVCPAQHQIHHSVDRKHWDKNMGFIFAFWDWAAGTLYAPKGKEDITYGLGTDEDGGSWHSLRALYFLPFRQSYARLFGKKDIQPTEPAE
ncbi:sterol desaturase family protein [Tabrizicola sp.]|uniref:sterol desaturase family protein n=1 Tax=Tabrizicola sp. TaxID=2005166 RepID=UPI00260C441F|nr:sterol desaturase family protein [Tabrizicola sp.]MDM7930663.1 sterol desaturase family protein [Tabrizicola sp.]